MAKPVSPLVGELAMSAWALTALGCADEAGLLDELDEPRSVDAVASRTRVPVALVEAILDVLLALGLVRRDGMTFAAEPTLAESLTGPARMLLQAELRSHLLQSAYLIKSAGRRALSTGWRYTDPQILQAQGMRSSAVAAAWVEHVFPSLNGLSLDTPEAAFLDVGTGVAAIAIEVCQHYPAVQVVGLDPWKPALAEARSNIEAAGLGNRITLREGRIQDLADDSAFDLVHVPVIFLSAEHAELGLRRAWTALKPGGWVLLQMAGTPGHELTSAVLRLWCVMWGGDAGITPARAEQMLADADYEDIRIFPALPGPPVRYVAGRRPPTHDDKQRQDDEQPP